MVGWLKSPTNRLCGKQELLAGHNMAPWRTTSLAMAAAGVSIL